MRILHIADVHLDRPFVRADRRAGGRDRQRLRDTFRDCLRLAADREVDAVTIGGDLWEDEHVSADTKRFVTSELERLSTPVLIVCGNHDPLRPGGHYERTQWPENVTLFTESIPVEHRLNEECSVWGLSWAPSDPTAEFLNRRVTPEDGRTHLLLMHGTAASFAPALEDDGFCPFDPRSVRDAGFSICLAGHIHRGSHDDTVVYPGSPEPLGWGEMGRHCAAIATLDEGRIEIDLIEVNRHVYEQIEVDCESCEHGAEVDERLRQALPRGENDTRHLRVSLKGQVGRECEFGLEHLTGLHGANLAELQLVDATHLAYDLDALAAQPDATGHFVKAMRERIDSEEDEGECRILELALDRGLRALHGRKDIVHVD